MRDQTRVAKSVLQLQIDEKVEWLDFAAVVLMGTELVDQ